MLLLPTLGLVAFGAYVGYERSREADRARDVVALTERAGVLLRLKLLFTNETFSTAGAATVDRFDLDPAVLEQLVGFDPVERMDEDRRAVDAIVRSDIDIPELEEPYRRLVRARAALDAGELELDEVLARLSSVHGALTVAASSALDAAEDGARAGSGSNQLRQRTLQLRAAVDAATGVGLQLEGLSQLLTPAVPVNQQVALDRIRIGLSTSMQADAQLDRLTTGSLRRQWMLARSSGATAVLREASEDYAAMAPAQVPPIDFESMVLLFADGVRSLDQFDALADGAAARTLTAAEALLDRALRERQTAFVAAGLIALLSLVVTGLITRSITLPLRSLARRAGRVTSGNLDDQPRGATGPQELVEVSTTLDELVDNLRVVESQLGALASGSFDDPVLDVPVPGRLGTLLHDSVLHLSRSIAEREQLAQRLEHDAAHDALTGVANRSAFLDALRLAMIDRHGDLALIKIDLVGFKPVNQLHGHDTGDRVLRVTADRLQSDVGFGGLVARIGGDEFGVVVVGVDATEAEAIALELVAHLAEPVSVGAVVTQVRARAGLAMAEAGIEPEQMIQQAALAVKGAKADGGGIARFDADMLAEVDRRADTERRLSSAITGNELELHYQPVVNRDMRWVSAEALVRWRQPDGRLVLPGSFIPVAEASDLVIDLGRWVLREACRALAGWQADPRLADLRLSVNLSGRHVMSMNVVDDVRAALARFGVEPNRLAVEVTETVLLGDLAVATDHLHRLRDLGVTIAVDDFGTGYTSLAHLRQLPVDLIKIDRSLVVAAAERLADAKVVELVVGAAHAMGMRVIGEGVETDSQLAMLRDAGCDFVQGYLTGRPTPEAELRAVASATVD